MEKRVCKSCCATKDIEEFDGFKTCNRCREAKRKCYKKNQKEYNQARREERAKGSQVCEECGHKIKHENWDAHFHYALHPNSELNVLMKDYLRKLGNLRKEGKLNDDIQAELRQNTKSRKGKYANENNFLINLLMMNHSLNQNNLNPILIKYSITSISC